MGIGEQEEWGQRRWGVKLPVLLTAISVGAPMSGSTPSLLGKFGLGFAEHRASESLSCSA